MLNSFFLSHTQGPTLSTSLQKVVFNGWKAVQPCHHDSATQNPGLCQSQKTRAHAWIQLLKVYFYRHLSWYANFKKSFGSSMLRRVGGSSNCPKCISITQTAVPTSPTWRGPTPITIGDPGTHSTSTLEKADKAWSVAKAKPAPMVTWAWDLFVYTPNLYLSGLKSSHLKKNIQKRRVQS